LYCNLKEFRLLEGQAKLTTNAITIDSEEG